MSSSSESDRVLLRGQADAYAVYDPADGTLVEACGAEVPSEWTAAAGGTLASDGWYRWVERQLVALFVLEGRVWLRLGSRQLPLAGPAAVWWTRQPNGMAQLMAFPAGGGEPVSLVYFGGDGSGVPPELDVTPTNPEDFDAGEFVYRRVNDPPRLAELFGEGLLFDPSWRPDQAALAGVDSDRQPARDLALAPLAGDAPNHMVDGSAVEAFDAAVVSFVRRQASAPLAGRDGEPAVMPVALALTDASRKVALEVGRRACARAAREGDPAALTDAAVLLVLAGLDCDPSSQSFQEARAGARELAAATKDLRIRPRSLIEGVGPRVGPVGAWRLAEALRTERRLSRRLRGRLRRASARRSV